MINSTDKKYYITFGQIHTHSINGITFDKDIVAEITADTYEEARKKAFELFGNKFAFIRQTNDLETLLQWFPRGIIKI